MLRLIYLHRFTSFGVILPGGRQKKKIMLLLHSLLSFSFYSNPGPRTTRPSCHFLGLYENASSFSQQEKNVRSLACLLRRVHGSAAITYPEMKTKGTTTSKKCHQHIMVCVCVYVCVGTPADEVRQLQDVRPPSSSSFSFFFFLLLLRQPWPGAAASSSLIQTRTK